jgi:hypothetical protein
VGRRLVAEGALGRRARGSGSRRHQQAGAARSATHLCPSLPGARSADIPRSDSAVSCHAITEPEAWRTRPGAIEDHQLLLEEERLRHDRAHAAWAGEPRDGRNHMHQKDGQITHPANPSKITKSSKTFENWDFAMHTLELLTTVP